MRSQGNTGASFNPKPIAFFCAMAILIIFAALYERRMRHASSSAAATSGSARVAYYVDPMHPAYKSDHPGLAPDCGMKLVPVYAGSGEPSGYSGRSIVVNISVDQQRLIGMTTVTAERDAKGGVRRAIGTVAVDDSRVYTVTSGVEGWIRETANDSVGNHTKAGQRLASFYSPEMIALEQGFLVSTERANGSVSQQAAPTTQAAAARLRDHGMGEKQVEEIATLRQLPEFIDITAPGNGVIVARGVSPGQRFEKGVELYRIADLSHVWIVADLPETQEGHLRPGTTTLIHLPGQSRALLAHVSNVLPSVDPRSRISKVRLEAENGAGLLLPNMSVELEVPEGAMQGLSIPVDALIDSGTEQRVYVKVGDTRFEPRTVTVGHRYNDMVEILRGLNSGEEVVNSGTFLVDAEYRLRNARSSAPSTASAAF